MTGKILALALLVVALVAGVSVAVPALDQPDRPPSRAPLLVGGEDDRDRPERTKGAKRDDQQARNERDDRQGGGDRDDRDDRDRDDDVSDSDDNVQVIRPRPGGGEVPDADDDDDTDDDTDDETDDSDDSDDGDGDD